jgi:hypothetical protein
MRATPSFCVYCNVVLTVTARRGRVVSGKSKSCHLGKDGLLRAAINQAHSGIANSHNLCKDKFGAPADAFQYILGQIGIGGIANNELQRFGLSISGSVDVRALNKLLPMMSKFYDNTTL